MDTHDTVRAVTTDSRRSDAATPQAAHPVTGGAARSLQLAMSAARPQPGYPGPPRRPEPAHAATTGRRLSKAEALSIAGRLKTTVLAGALVGFGGMSVLLASHAQSASTATQATSTGSSSSSSSQSSLGSFFNQGGASFGSGSSSSSSPSSASSVS